MAARCIVHIVRGVHGASSSGVQQFIPLGIYEIELQPTDHYRLVNFKGVSYEMSSQVATVGMAEHRLRVMAGELPVRAPPARESA